MTVRIPDATTKTTGITWQALRGALIPDNVLAESTDRRYVGSTALAALTSGRLFLVAVVLERGDILSSLGVLIATAATTPTNLWYALYDGSLGLLRVTADNGGGAAAGGAIKSLALASSYTATYRGLYYVGLVSVAATPIAPRGYGSSSNSTGIAPILAGMSTTGLTDPASAPNPAGAITADGRIPYVQVT